MEEDGTRGWVNGPKQSDLLRLGVATSARRGKAVGATAVQDCWRVDKVPIIFTDRFQGSSKMSGHIVWEAIWMVWRLWFQNGLRRWPKQRS